MRRLFNAIFISILLLFLNSVNGSEASDSMGGLDQGKRWAFCIGINDYKDSGIIDLTSASNDARGLAQVLKDNGRFDHVVLMTDDLDKSDERFPTLSNIRSVFRDYAKRIKRQDLVLFSFFGHGLTSPSGRAFLLAENTRPGNLQQTGLPLDAVLGFLEKTAAGGRLLFLDASREAVLKGAGSAGSGVYPDRYLREGVTAVFYAAKKGQISHDHVLSNHGVFGESLIHGLKGDADSSFGGNRDGLVTLMELVGQMNGEMAAWSMEWARNQSPYIKILERGMENLVLSSVAGTGQGEADAPALPAAKTEALKEESKGKAEAKIESMTAPEVEKGAEATPGPMEEPKEERLVIEEKPKEEMTSMAAPAPEVEAPGAEKETERAKPALEEAAEMTEKPEQAPSEMKGAPSEDRPEALPDGRPSPETMAKTPETEAGEKAEAAVEERPAVLPDTLPHEETMETTPEKETGEKAAAVIEKNPEPETVPSGQTLPAVPETVSKEEAASAVEKRGEIEPAPTPIFLRNRPRDLSAEELNLTLHRYRFYATCWNYNGDFCNPDGDFKNRLTDNKDGTVSDLATGLMWMKGGAPTEMTWAEARAYVEQLNREGFAGYRDWRLPTVEELGSLMENSWQNSDLFIDPVFDRTQRYCWSIDNRGMSRAWKVNFHLGIFLDFPMTTKNSVRAVRSAPMVH